MCSTLFRCAYSEVTLVESLATKCYYRLKFNCVISRCLVVA